MSGAKYVHDGSRIKHTPGSALTAGDVVVQSELIGIAVDDIAANEEGVLVIEGEFILPKNTGYGFAVGDIAYWDDADDEVQNTSDTGANNQIGKITEVCVAADTTCRVKLIP